MWRIILSYMRNWSFFFLILVFHLKFFLLLFVTHQLVSVPWSSDHGRRHTFSGVVSWVHKYGRGSRTMIKGWAKPIHGRTHEIVSTRNSGATRAKYGYYNWCPLEGIVLINFFHTSFANTSSTILSSLAYTHPHHISQPHKLTTPIL